MELTSIGYLYLPIAMWCFLQSHEKHLLSLLLVSTVLQAASVINISVGALAHGLNPFMCTIGLLALKMLPKLGAVLRGISGRAPIGSGLWLGAYLLWSAAVTLVMPQVFEGTLVRAPYDAYSGATVPLRFSLVNAWHIVGLCAIAVMFAFPAVQGISQGHLHAGIKLGLMLAFTLVALSNLYEQVAHVRGLPSLVEFWTSNPGYNQEGARVNYGWHARVGVPFTEPSYASGYLVSFIGGLCLFLTRRHPNRQVYGALGLAVLVLLSTGGSTGLVSLGLFSVGGWLYCVSRVARHIFSGKQDERSVYWVFTLLGLAVVALITFAPGMLGSKFHSSFTILVLDKLNVSNFGTLARLNADLHGLHLLKETDGLGVGLGSNRTSSFISSMLSSVGVVGTLLFVGFVYRLMRDYGASFPRLSGLQLFGLGAVLMMLLPMCLSIPDLNLPVLWAALWVLYELRPSRG